MPNPDYAPAPNLAPGYAQSGTSGALRVEEEGSSVVAAATGMNFAGLPVTVTDAGSDEALVTVRALEVITVALSDETTALTTGNGKVTMRMPFAMTLTGVRSSVTTAPTGATLIVDINEAGSTILSTKLSIDASEKTSTTAASAAVISDTALADDAEITFDIDQIGSTIAGAGLKVSLIGYRA